MGKLTIVRNFPNVLTFRNHSAKFDVTCLKSTSILDWLLSLKMKNVYFVKAKINIGLLAAVVSSENSILFFSFHFISDVWKHRVKESLYSSEYGKFHRLYTAYTGEFPLLKITYEPWILKKLHASINGLSLWYGSRSTALPTHVPVPDYSDEPMSRRFNGPLLSFISKEPSHHYWVESLCGLDCSGNRSRIKWYHIV